jgi:hypothetical protein
VVAVLVVEEPLLHTERAGLWRACRARSRQKAKGSFSSLSLGKGSSDFCEKSAKKASQRGACLGECNAEMQRAALFDAWAKVVFSYFYVQRCLFLRARRSIDGRCLESTRAVPERSREPVSADCITCARSM